jgi:hypothetical protein
MSIEDEIRDLVDEIVTDKVEQAIVKVLAQIYPDDVEDFEDDEEE